MSEVRCRSKRSKGCYDGHNAEAIYGDHGMAEDGTFDGTTVVCDACYIAAGQPSIPVDHPEARTFGASIEQGDPR